MTLVTVPQVNPNDEITAASVNDGDNAIATVVNGNLDDTNVASLSGTKLAAGTVPASAMTTDANPETRLDETLGDFIASGLVWSSTAGLNGAMTAGVAYVNGKRLSVSLVASKAFTASKDTYIYVDSTGTIQYDAQTNGASQPTTPANYVLLAKVVTSGSAVTSVTEYRQTLQFGSWQSWTPTWTNLTVGSGTTNAKYARIGSTVHFRLLFRYGSGSSMGSNPSFTLPIPAISYGNTSTGAPAVGQVHFEDNGTATFMGFVDLTTSTTARPILYNVASTYASNTAITSTVPFTWTTGDELIATGTYEAAV